MRLRKKAWIETAMPALAGKYVYLRELEQFRGRWREKFPGKELALEIGCGKGRFLAGMAALYPEQAFVGVETQHDIAYYAGKALAASQLTNAVVLCANAEQLEEWFEPGEIAMIYLNFSDPWPKARHSKRRLTHRNFLVRYAHLLNADGRLRLKTDNRAFFDFSLEEFRDFGLELLALSYDLHNSAFVDPVWTEYEQKFSTLGKTIYFCEVSFAKKS